MFRPTIRAAISARSFHALPEARASRRLLSTAPPHQKSRSWKSSAARWTAAGVIVYYYNTASTFAEEPAYTVHAPRETERETEIYPSVASVAEQRRAQYKQRLVSPEQHGPRAENVAVVAEGEATPADSPGALEEEANQQGAFNEETGEINWDCPCLGGMAYGPCGEQFRAAFSCFVFSKEEPKGVDCIEHFKTMQDCFRSYPEVYGSELEDEDVEPPETAKSPTESISAESQAARVDSPSRNEAEMGDRTTSHNPDSTPQARNRIDRTESTTQAIPATKMGDEVDDALPKPWHDAKDVSKSP